MNEIGTDEKNHFSLNFSSEDENYFKENLIEKEFEELKTLVDDSLGTISWKKLVEKDVVKIKGKKVEGIYWKGGLDIRGTLLKSLWKFKEINNYLYCEGVEELEDLGELEYVGESILLEGTSIKSLGKLKIVEGSLYCKYVIGLEDLGELKKVGKNCNFTMTSIKTLGKLKKVRSLDCEGVKTLEDLGELEEVGGECYLIGTSVKSLGKLKKVGDLYCEGVKTLEDLGELEEVIEDCNLEGTAVRSLGKLKTVIIDLFCNGLKDLESLGNLEEVENLFLIGVNTSLQIKIINLLKEGKFKIAKNISFGGDIEGIEKILEQEQIPGILSLEDCHISIQLEALYMKKIDKLHCIDILVEEGLEEDVVNLYPNNRVDLIYFSKLFGNNLNEVNDIELKKYGEKILIREYKKIKEDFKEKGKKIRKENEGRTLAEEEKKELRETVKSIAVKFKNKKEEIESFGIIL